MEPNRTVSLTSSPMGIKKHIPNFITLCNLACGAIGIVLAFESELSYAALMIFAGAFFDFFDGFAARLLKVSNELGKQLDSMADMVTFGVLPAVIAYNLLDYSLNRGLCTFGGPTIIDQYGAYIAILIAVFSGLRLAKFNIDTRQTDSFIGMPTPMNAMFWASIPLIIQPYVGMEVTSNDAWILAPEVPNFLAYVMNEWSLLICIVLLSLLLVSEIPMIALKFKNFGWKDNKVRYIFLAIAILTIIGGLLIKNVFVSIPIILLLYLIISIVNNLISKGNEVQSGN